MDVVKGVTLTGVVAALVAVLGLVLDGPLADVALILGLATIVGAVFTALFAATNKGIIR